MGSRESQIATIFQKNIFESCTIHYIISFLLSKYKIGPVKKIGLKFPRFFLGHKRNTYHKKIGMQLGTL